MGMIAGWAAKPLLDAVTIIGGIGAKAAAGHLGANLVVAAAATAGQALVTHMSTPAAAAAASPGWEPADA